MAKSRRNQYRQSFAPTLMIGGTALGLFGLVGLLVAWSVGAFDRDPTQEVDRTGQLAFPALARPVPAFEAIRREHLIDPRTGQLNVVWLPESSASKASRRVSDLIGRVLSRDKAAGMVLTEWDFLPAGTKPGVSAGIPPGKFAVTIPTTEIPGLEQLRHGDRFDLMVALNREDSDSPAVSSTEPAAVFGGIKPPSLRVGQLSQQHGVKRLVTGGQMIALTQGNQQSTSGNNGLTVRPSNNRSSSKATTYAEIAIDEEEIGPLTEAISLDTAMTCIVRSGRPEAEMEEAFTREGLVQVITTATNVAAYAELTDQALIDSGTGKLHFYYFPPDRVPEHWLTDPTEVYGRVASRSLRRGSPITEADLLPIGTKPGISAGVPPGMVAMAVRTQQLSGFGDLIQGDRFAIHAKVPAEAQRPVQNLWAKLQGGSLSPATERFERMLSTGIREVVTEAIYLRESDPDTATIAVPDDRVAEVAQLIRDQSELFVVARGSVNAPPAKTEKTAESPQRSETPSHRIDAAVAQQSNHTLVAAQFGELPSVNDNPVDDARADRVAVPILTRDVEAFESLTVEDFTDPASGSVRMLFFPPGRLRTEWITDINELIDRVTSRSLKAGRTVSQDDLAPQGVTPGPSAGVSAGMRGILVDSSQIEDLDLLSPGTTFSIAVGGPINAGELGDQVRQTLSSADAVSESAKLPGVGFSAYRPIATGAILLKSYDEQQRTETLTVTDNTVTRTEVSGLIVKEQTEQIPRFETITSTVRRFAIAVPEAEAPAVIGSLNRQRSLRVVLQGNEGAAVRDVSGRGSIKAFVREHFYGNDRPFTEVFVSNRDYSGASVPSIDPARRQGGPNE